MKNQNKQYKIRCTFIIIIFVFIITVCVLRLIDWQIVNGQKYFELANKNNIFTVKTEPLRGEILDSNGLPFAQNVLEYNVILDRFAINKEKENEIIESLIILFKKEKEDFVDNLPIEIDKKTNQYLFLKDKEAEIKELKGKTRLNLNSYATANDCVEKICERFNYTNNKDIELKRDVASVKYGMLASGYYQAMNTSYTFAKGISTKMLSIICEKYQDIAGIRISTSPKRELVNSDIIPHIVGFAGKMSLEQYEQLKNNGDYTIEDVVGKSGIELSMESYLKGKKGEKKLEISKDGKLLDAFETISPEPGKTIFLTIDSNLQKATNASLEKYVKMAHAGAGDCVAGAAVVLDVRDFSVLAMSTYPSYDAKKFLEDKSYNEAISKNRTIPIFNRAINGTFAPGSTFKPLVAMSALESGTITDKDTVTCHRIYYYPGSNFTNKCLGNHGAVPLRSAMARSCNVYFSEAGRRAGINNINKFCRNFGLGSPTGIELKETLGVIAGPEHSRKIGSIWDNRITIKASIGQADNLFTPLQLATYAATIANGGHRYKVHLVKKITDYKRQHVFFENKIDSPELICESGISSNNLNIVKDAMRAVATSGTASMFSGYPVPIAAKTGTAQCTGSDHTLFICFAPYNDPKIAIAVVIEHGAKGFASKGVAKDILDAYFLKK